MTSIVLVTGASGGSGGRRLHHRATPREIVMKRSAGEGRLMTLSLTGLGPAVGSVRSWLGWLVVLGLLVPVAAYGASPAEPDARAVRQVIEAQLDAFAADDAERAFSYASPSIRAQFGDANTFMAMVRAGYPMLVRPAAVSFLQAQADDGAEPANVAVRQSVRLRDRDRRLWIATYVLERQGAAWRINGCVVRADSAEAWI
jgi:hypothetical protein